LLSFSFNVFFPAFFCRHFSNNGFTDFILHLQPKAYIKTLESDLHVSERLVIVLFIQQACTLFDVKINLSTELCQY